MTEEVDVSYNQEDGIALGMGSGFVGQEQAREAAGLVVDMIRQKKMIGQALLFVGALGTRKTALALGISQDLGSKLYWLSPSSATLIKKDIASQPISLCSPRWPILSPSSRSGSSSAYSTEIKIQCWSCGETKPDSSILICPSCKAVQALHPSMDYFKIFDQDQLFNINLKELEGKYKNLMKKLHPDLSHGKSKEEKENSAEVSAFVTQAYNELLNPVSRAAYLLKIKGIYVDEEGTVFDPEIITEVMEIREALEGAPNRDTLEKLCDKARSKMGEWSNVFNAAYKQGDNTAAVAALQRMSYFGRVFQDIKRELL